MVIFLRFRGNNGRADADRAGVARNPAGFRDRAQKKIVAYLTGPLGALRGVSDGLAGPGQICGTVLTQDGPVFRALIALPFEPHRP